MRQGCPLSTLLFTVVMEPWALSVRASRLAVGVNTPMGRQCNLFMYADDVSVVAQDPDSILATLELFKLCAWVSGVAISFSKSTIVYGHKVVRESRDWVMVAAGGIFRALGIYVGGDSMVKCKVAVFPDYHPGAEAGGI